MTKNYEDYVAKVTTLGADEVAKPAVKAKFIESYNNMAAVLLTQTRLKLLNISTKH
jgi:hypothetical protein